jgi:ketosteroid isomerase-like protein
VHVGEFAQLADDYISALDALDVERLMANVADDAKGVDEIARRWIRGKSDVDAYIRQLTSAVSDVHSQLKDSDEKVWGDAGVVTCWLEQTYSMEGQTQSVSAPTTIVFRREGGAWKLTLFHSVPLPEQS